MRVSAITPTGARPESLKLCMQYMQRQTFRDFEHIIIDDSATWKPGQNTQGVNLKKGLAVATGDIIAIIEDDDWYHPDYLKTMVAKIEEGYDIVGEAQGIYYNLPSNKFHRHPNRLHAGLCQTVFRRSLVPIFERVIQGGMKYFDMELWKKTLGAKRFLFPAAKLVVGMKGLPGRPGIGAGHIPTNKWHKDTLDRAKLRQLIGDDVELYKNI